MVPKSKAPLTGSSWIVVPGIRNPLGTTVPGTGGPMICMRDGSSRLAIAQPNVSRRRVRARANDLGFWMSW